MGESISDILAREDKNWKETKVDQKGNPLADGVYHAIVSDAKLTTSKSGNAMLVFELTIQEGRNKGRKQNVYNLLSGKGLSFTKQKIETMCIDVENLSDLVPLVQQGAFIGIILQIKVVSNGDNTNIYFQKRLNAPEEDYPEVSDEEIDEMVEPEEKTPW